MPKRSSKPKRSADTNQLAKSIVDIATDETPADEVDVTPEDEGKNPAAVALGRLGGLKGGAARAKALSKKKRAEIAKRAAKARWAAKRQ